MAKGLAGGGSCDDSWSIRDGDFADKVNEFDIGKLLCSRESDFEKSLAVVVPFAEDVGAFSPQFDSGVGEAGPNS